MPGLTAPATDPGLPALDTALDTEAMLDPLIRAAGIARRPGLRCSADVIAHKPGQRCTIRYAIDGHDERVEVIGKVYRRPAMAQRVAGWLRAAGEPVPLAVLPELGLLVRPYVPGRDLRHALDVPGAVELCARWLAGMHNAPPPAEVKVKPLAHEMAKLDAWCDQIEPVLAPGTATRLREARGRLHGVADSLPAAPPALVHRDFYYANVIWDGTRVWVLDYDELGVGDPCFDVGHFLAHLEVLAYRTTGAFDTHSQVTVRFTRAYAGRALEAERIRLYRAYTFVKLAATETRRQRSGWRELTDALAARASSESDAEP